MQNSQIRTMLESEIKTSGNFTKENFGMKIGDDFPEIVCEIIKSPHVTARLLVMLLAIGIGGKDAAMALSESARETGEENKEKVIQKAILSNFDAFDTPFEFFYWGIQIGRKLERQQTEALKSIETQGK